MSSDFSSIQILKQDVCKCFGKQIVTAKDCDDLSTLLFQKFNKNLSSQTLRRFFGLIKTDSNASVFTLDLLSAFCGFTDFQDFLTNYSSSELENFFAGNDEFGKDYWQKSEFLCQQISESP